MLVINVILFIDEVLIDLLAGDGGVRAGALDLLDAVGPGVRDLPLAAVDDVGRGGGQAAAAEVFRAAECES